MDNPKFAPDNTVEQKQKNTLRNRLILLGTGAVLTTNLVAGCAPNVEAKPDLPDPEPDGTSQIEETPKPTVEFSGIPTIDNLEISAELSNEAAAKRLVEIISEWHMAGVNDSNFENQFVGENVYLTQSEYIRKIVEAAKPIFAKAIYGENWQDARFEDSIRLLADTHANILEGNFSTRSDSYSEPYSRTQSFESASINSTNQTVDVIMVALDNAQAIGLDKTVNGTKNTFSVKFEDVNGKKQVTEPLVFSQP